MIEEEIEFANKPNEDSFFQITYYMSGKLGLKGAELMLYGLINGFSQDGYSFCYSSMSYIEELTGMSHATLARAMDSLVQKNLIVTEQVQSYYKQAGNGKIVQVKAKGSQYFSLRYTVKSRPAIQKIIDDLKFYANKISGSKQNISAEIIRLIIQIKENEAKNKARSYKSEIKDSVSELNLESVDGISKALLEIHFNSFNEKLISKLLELLKNCFSDDRKIESQNETGKNNDVADEHLSQNETRSSLKMRPEDAIHQSQNETRSSLKMRHNNNQNINLNSKTTTSTTINSADADDFTAILIKLFGYNPCFPAESSTTLESLFCKYNVQLEFLEKYMTQMFIQLEKSCKDKSKFSIYYLKSFLNEGYISKFAYDLQQERMKTEEIEKSMLTCPVCGKRHSKMDYRCPECELSSDFITDESEISKAAAIYRLRKTDSLKYQEYENEISMLYEAYPMSKLFADKKLAAEKENKIRELNLKYLGITA